MSLRNDIVTAIHAQPPVNPGCRGMLALITQNDADLRELTRLIEADSSGCALILKAALAAGDAETHAEMTVARAVALLGRDRTCRLLALATCSTLINADVPGCDQYIGGLWRHAAATAVAAEAAVSMLGFTAERHTIFTAALLHDIGKAVLAPFVIRHAVLDSQPAYAKTISFEILERTVLGIDHAEAGAILLQQWDMPAGLCVPVRWHHDPDACPDASLCRIVDILHLADSMCLSGGIGAGREGLQYRLSSGALDRLKMKKTMLETIMSRAMAQLDDLIQTIEV